MAVADQWHALDGKVQRRAALHDRLACVLTAQQDVKIICAACVTVLEHRPMAWLPALALISGLH